MLTGFFLGLSNNFFCFLNCAAVFIPFTLSSGRKPSISVIQFMAGRLIAYVFFGFAAGYTSLYFDGKIDPLVFSSFTFLMALWLIFAALSGFHLNNPACRLAGRWFSGKYFPFFLGIVMGLNICPPFLLGLSDTLQMNSVLNPVIFFLGFYLGSSLWLAAFLFTGRLAANKILNTSAKFVSLAVGLWYLATSTLKIVYFIL